METHISYGLKEKPRRQATATSDVEFACKYAFQLFGRQAQMELSAQCYGYSPGLFGHHDGYRVAVLRYAHGGTVAQPEFLGYLEAVAYRQYAAGGAYPVLRYHHCAVMQRRVLEKDVFYQALVYRGVNHVARSYHFVERRKPFYHDERSNLVLAHAHAGHHDGHYGFHVVLVFFLARREQAYYAVHLAVRAEVVKKLAYLFLEQYYYGNDAHTHQFVHDAAQEAHLEHLAYEQPHQDEHHDADEHISSVI